jgi:type II restriction enzyme
MGGNLVNVAFGLTIAEKYHSPFQKIRVVAENWVKNQAYCPSCGCGVNSYENNKPVADFYCTRCREDYELKSKSIIFH